MYLTNFALENECKVCDKVLSLNRELKYRAASEQLGNSKREFRAKIKELGKIIHMICGLFAV